MRAYFEANPHEIVALVGPSGEGKTTLLRIMLALLHIQSGDEDLVGAKTGEVLTITPAARRLFSYVPQGNTMFSGTIAENMRNVRPDATDEEIFAALEIAQAKDVVSKKEKGLDTEVEQGGKNFSGGQRQRLTIARALVKQPEILILDDSSSALDFATDAALRIAIGSMKHKPTLFIVSQRTSAIQYADKIVVLDDGSVVGIGIHEELMNTCEVYREIYDSQYKRTK